MTTATPTPGPTTRCPRTRDQRRPGAPRHLPARAVSTTRSGTRGWRWANIRRGKKIITANNTYIVYQKATLEHEPVHGQ